VYDPDLPDELLDLELRARIKAGRRLVEQKQYGRRQQGTGERDFLLHAAGQVLHRLASAVGRKPDPAKDPRNLVAGLTSRYPIEAGRVAEVLSRRHLLEEAGLD
jgi:hypothetical protein